MRRYFLAWVVVAWLTGVVWSVNPPFPGVSPGIQNRRVVALADRSYPPYSYMDEDGKPAGFEVELLQAIAKTQGFSVEYRLLPWTHALEEMNNGKGDVILGIFYTDERSTRLDFTIPHSVDRYILVVPKSSSVRDIDGCQGHTLFADRGNATIERFNTSFRLTRNVVWTDSVSASLRELDRRGGNGFSICTYSTASSAMAREGFQNLRILEATLYPTLMRFAVRRGDTRLLSALNEGLYQLKTSGEYAIIRARYEKYLDPPRSLAWWFLWLGGLLLVFCLLLLGVGIWNRSLARKVRERTAELENARHQADTLRNLLPICSSCKKVRDDSGYWENVESFLLREAGAAVTHGLCPDCATRLYPDFAVLPGVASHDRSTAMTPRNDGETGDDL